MRSLADNLRRLRKQYGFTQEKLSAELNISFQAISKWENGQSLPDIILLLRLSDIFHTSIDNLIGHEPTWQSAQQYEKFYENEKFSLDVEPSSMCYEVLKLKPPIKPWRILDVGCGEGINAVFFARNGYDVSAFDISEKSLAKAQNLADFYHVNVKFFQSDLKNFIPVESYDVIFSSGVLHYLSEDLRSNIIEDYKEHTVENGINAFNVFVAKPFLKEPAKKKTPYTLWRTGELAMLYHDWHFHALREEIFDCKKSKSYKHCMETVIVEKK